MTNYTPEQLQNYSKEELIAAILKTQSEYNVLLERLTANNANTYGKKSEQMEYDGQESFFNEAEAEMNEKATEPELEEITYKRRKQSGKRDEDLSAFPTTVIIHELPEEELTKLFGESGWKRLPTRSTGSWKCILPNMRFLSIILQSMPPKMKTG